MANENPQAAPGTVIVADVEPDLDAIAAKHVVPEGAHRPWAAPTAATSLQAEQVPALEQPAEEEGQEEEASAVAAPAAKPAAKPAEEPEEPAPAKREPLAHLLRKERELRQAQEKLKADEADIVARTRKAVLDELTATPGKILAEAKLAPKTLAQRLVTPEQLKEADPVAQELQALKTQLKALQDERDAKAAEAEQEAIVDAFRELVVTEPERWPLLNATKKYSAAAAEMLQHLEKTGQVLGDDEAADRVEAQLSELRDAMLGSSKPRPKGTPPAKKGTGTVSNQAAASNPAKASSQALPEDDDDAIAVIAARADRRLAEARAAAAKG